MVQELRKTVRRFDTGGEGSMLPGKLYCADCGGKMHYRRGTTRAGRDWRGIPNGEVQHTSAGFNCSTYNSSRKQYKQVCCSHSIKEVQEKLVQFEGDTDRTEEFLFLVHKYTDI